MADTGVGGGEGGVDGVDGSEGACAIGESDERSIAATGSSTSAKLGSEGGCATAATMRSLSRGESLGISWSVVEGRTERKDLRGGGAGAGFLFTGVEMCTCFAGFSSPCLIADRGGC